MRQAILCMRDAFRQLSTGRARVPLRVPVDTGDGVTLAMPAFLTDTRDLGVKVVSVYAGNAARGLPAVTAAVLVLDAGTGAPHALIDGTELTALRTGAASGLATDLLAREDAAVLALFGAGAQAVTQLEAVRAVRPLREVRIVARSLDSARRFAATLHDIVARPLTDRAQALDGADIVCTATTSATPVFDGALLPPGCHINAIGSYSPDTREVDATAVRRARVVVDSRQAALAEAGDLIAPIRDRVIDELHIAAEIGEIVAGLLPGRTAPDQITLFKSVGSAVQDVALARHVLDAAEARGLGASIDI